MVTIGIAGVSGYAQNHLRALRELEQQGLVRLVAAVAINAAEIPETVADLESRGVEIYGNYTAMLSAWQGRLDVVCLPTPIHLHASMTIAALEAGFHVFVEKPLSATVAEVEAIIAARERSGLFVGVGFQDISLPQAQEVKRLLLEGALGDLREIQIGALWPRGLAYFARSGWAGRIAVGDQAVYDSPLSNALAHFANLAFYWAGATPQVSCQLTGVEAELYRANPIENFDTIAARFMTDRSQPIRFLASHACTEEREARILVSCAAGNVLWHNGQDVTITWPDGSQKVEPLPRPGRYMVPMWRAFLDRLQGHDAPMATPEIACTHTYAVEMVQRSVPVQTVAADVLRERAEAITIMGLESVFDRAWSRGVLFSEAGASWAAPAPS
ncbi:MAG: Gfo/Idh/MocA family oxidoreductase [Verrucomicrobiota bacterium JB022]|nr:Gfo/Idh/MocA family oxidoreductase [Verrucomicrobiota bacterium JB022]